MTLQAHHKHSLAGHHKRSLNAYESHSSYQRKTSQRYQDSSLKLKDEEKSVHQVQKQGDTSRIDKLKASIEDGSYRVDIESLAKRIAQELT